MKYCGGCKVRERTEKVIFHTADGQYVKAWFCAPCWEKFRADHPEDAKVVTKTSGTS